MTWERKNCRRYELSEAEYEADLRAYETLFQREGDGINNPIYAWEAFRHYADPDRPLPRWLFEYLFRASVVIDELSYSSIPPDDATDMVLKHALGMRITEGPDGESVRFNAIRDYRENMEDKGLADFINRKIAKGVYQESVLANIRTGRSRTSRTQALERKARAKKLQTRLAKARPDLCPLSRTSGFMVR